MKLPLAVLLLAIVANVFALAFSGTLDTGNAQHEPVGPPASVDGGGDLVAQSPPEEIRYEALAPAALPSLDIAPQPRVVTTDGLELAVARSRIAWLESELIACGSAEVDTPVGRWVAMMRPEDRPDLRTLRLMAEYLIEYPVRLQPDEGRWIAERTTLDDWDNWAPSIDEALILFLGPARIAHEVPQENLDALRAYWFDEGYFE